MSSAPSSQSHSLSVIIVNYQVRELLRACLRSLESALSGLEAEVWVVDNASGDGSAEMVAQEFPWVRLLDNRTNVGFAAANNQALQQVSAGYVLLLNPDTEIEAVTVRELIAFMERHPTAGIVGPALVGRDGNRQIAVRSFPRLGETLAGLAGVKSTTRTTPEWPEAPGTADWISGAALMIRAQALHQVGLMDEAFFIYGEDVDYCRRMWDQGWEVWHLPSVSVTHVGGQSAAQLNALEDRRLWLEQTGRNEYIYFRKHRGWLAASLIRWTSVWASLASGLKWKWLGYWRADPAARKLSSVYVRKALDGCRRWGLAKGAEPETRHA